jgi:hypothetical protein
MSEINDDTQKRSGILPITIAILIKSYAVDLGALQSNTDLIDDVIFRKGLDWSM